MKKGDGIKKIEGKRNRTRDDREGKEKREGKSREEDKKEVGEEERG